MLATLPLALAACDLGSATTTHTTVNLSDWNAGLWMRSDGYSNGGDFNVGWRADHAVARSGRLAITLDTTPCPDGCSGDPYASGEMHTYTIQWLPNSIAWIVDGKTLYTATSSPASMPTTPANLFLNFWTGTANVTDWLGPFTYAEPQQVLYGSASFTPAVSH